jgi:hypothetical protein
MLTICDLETTDTYGSFGGSCGINLRLHNTRRHIPKESNRIHNPENLRSEVAGFLGGQLLEYLQGRSKVRAAVSRGGSTMTSDIRPGKRRQVAQTPAEHAVQLTYRHSTCNWFHTHTHTHTHKGSLFKKYVIRKARTVPFVAEHSLPQILQSAVFPNGNCRRSFILIFCSSGKIGFQGYLARF